MTDWLSEIEMKEFRISIYTESGKSRGTAYDYFDSMKQAEEAAKKITRKGEYAIVALETGGRPRC